MAERKVINKYFPPDFDPSKIPRLRQSKSQQIKVRLMAPFSMRCSTCGQWIGKGTKFNARKEAIENAKFHSIQIFRFYIRCQKCASEITFKTDPENLNYEVERGAQRNFEPWREEKEINEEEERKKTEGEEGDPLKALENRTEESRREMEVMDALDEIRVMNARGERVGGEAAMEAVAERARGEEERRREDEEREDERLARMAFAPDASADADGDPVETGRSRRIKRAREEDAVRRERAIKRVATSVRAPTESRAPVIPLGLSKALLGIKRVRPRDNCVDAGVVVEEVECDSSVTGTETSRPDATTLAGMLGAYGSGDSDNSDSE
ncbi:Pre-mRNA-splicing factor cwf16 [Kickxella alabastrina]|uniref:Pre-mRNA-splicing factor cwf16 n=1 Tax=Kickxella alabastrina TaxID=61397 RepID=A0ACC1ILQ2_9FUNG|nr:Pre-mRNA-splicing factor cwf16 [Kickxella alabastrina]